MPDECPSMRSMARWVLPVLVGPSTAVTPAPRGRASRGAGDENEMAIVVLVRRPASAAGLAPLYHNAPPLAAAKADALRLRTSLERNAPESLTPALSSSVHPDISGSRTAG